ncbi:MAG: hypothetical protein FJ290_06620 [Planctomycetes bacterium]|nr:hypothetical protein [Planctomycetota bacterium]
MEDQVTGGDAGADTLELAWTLKAPAGPNPTTDAPEVEPGNVPRISRLMALAIKFDDLIRRGEVEDYATLARLGHVTRARITQIMALLNLAPDIQEAILFLPRIVRGRDLITERDLRAITAMSDWDRQRVSWRGLRSMNTAARERPSGSQPSPAPAEPVSSRDQPVEERRRVG